MSNTNSGLSSVLHEEATSAGRRFRGKPKAAAMSWFKSQSNTIGYPYMDISTYAMVERVFLEAAGHRVSGRGK